MDSVHYPSAVKRHAPFTAELWCKEAWRLTSAEFLATLLFVFLCAGAQVASDKLEVDQERTTGRALLVGLTAGLGYAALIYMTTHVSGGFMNPAITVSQMMARHMRPMLGLMYLVAEVLGGIFGVLILKGCVGKDDGSLGATTVQAVTAGHAFFIEFILTFLLAFTVFATVEHPRTMGKQVPLMIGFVLVAAGQFASPYTGSSLNPAWSFGAATWSGEWEDHWLYWVAPMLGGTFATVLYVFFFHYVSLQADRVHPTN